MTARWWRIRPGDEFCIALELGIVQALFDLIQTSWFVLTHPRLVLRTGSLSTRIARYCPYCWKMCMYKDRHRDRMVCECGGTVSGEALRMSRTPEAKPDQDMRDREKYIVQRIDELEASLAA